MLTGCRRTGSKSSNEEALRVLNSQGRGSKGSPALPNGRGRSPQGSATRRKPPACAARWRTGEKKLCAVKLLKRLTQQAPYSIERLLEQAF